jgi:hypothetical protein
MRVPALPPLRSLPQEIEDPMKIVGIEPGKRVNPVVGFREAKQHRHKATFPQDKVLSVRSAGAVTPGCLETAKQEFQISIGTWQQWWLEVLKQMGSKGAGDLLNVGHYTPQFCRKTALLKLMYKGQSLRWGFRKAGLSFQEMSDLMNPAEESYQLFKFFLEHIQYG